MPLLLTYRESLVQMDAAREKTVAESSCSSIMPIRGPLFVPHSSWMYQMFVTFQYSCFYVLQAATHQDMTYWLQELQQKRWEYCNSLDVAKRDSQTLPTPSDFSKGLVAKDHAGDLSRLLFCTTSLWLCITTVKTNVKGTTNAFTTWGSVLHSWKPELFLGDGRRAGNIPLPFAQFGDLWKAARNPLGLPRGGVPFGGHTRALLVLPLCWCLISDDSALPRCRRRSTSLGWLGRSAKICRLLPVAQLCFCEQLTDWRERSFCLQGVSPILCIDTFKSAY